MPHRVLDALVEHFCRFATERRSLPVIWHQSLLTFAQRYKGDLTAEDKERLKALMRAQEHPLITPEIRRELFSAPNRGEPKPTSMLY